MSTPTHTKDEQKYSKQDLSDPFTFEVIGPHYDVTRHIRQRIEIRPQIENAMREANVDESRYSLQVFINSAVTSIGERTVNEICDRIRRNSNLAYDGAEDRMVVQAVSKQSNHGPEPQAPKNSKAEKEDSKQAKESCKKGKMLSLKTKVKSILNLG